jgi:FtsP/CotA-like multicopper oxidase with cupredoxin domain
MSIASPAVLQLLDGQNVTAQGCTPPGIVAIQGDFQFNFEPLPPELAYSCNPTDITPTIFHVDSTERWVSFNFILAASVQVPMVSIDDHEMWVYAADGHFIEPQLVDGLHIESAQRYSALVRLKDKPDFDAYTMRFSNVGANQILFATALLSYVLSDNHVTIAPDSYARFNQAGNATDSSAITLDSNALAPYPAIKPAQYSNVTHVLDAGRHGASWRWTLSVSTTPIMLTDG